jgi:glycosyltransferase involved in cell wall biosynthesis
VPSTPLVSICVPTARAARWIAGAIESALAQTHEDFELLVVDNGPPDGTEEIVRSFDDPRLRFERNDREPGIVANHNWVTRRARAPLVKYLHADDMLAPTSVERLVEVALRSERIGFVFGRRAIELDRPEDPEARAWAAGYGALHGRLGPLDEVNDGRRVFERWLPGMFRERAFVNWVGEPTSVLVRRAALERVGLFNPRLPMLMDAELWLRVAFSFDVGFVDEELSTYRHHGRSSTAGLAESGAHWLDKLWLIESLLAVPEIAAAHPELRRERLAEARWAARMLAARARRGQRLRLAELREYAAYLAARTRPRLHPTLTPRPA